ncbi:PREDICTED: universal stress protein A-like protein [Erythranthe guttata]|uniref:universal stress protein A-like protein n=1 Tax=Erythranthe guttata TaxID=4155 RepID=UPI00064DE8E2|nr:PREDICTED: universal stress protein A-like protein [Erythranthe guttata]|eukprot:XP_012833288.1 PREDICTED: universal stress protein A-like protein [Erythranthe guttata]
MMMKVMVAIDESDCSNYALKWTVDNLRDSLIQSHLIIFTVQPLSDYAYIHASSFGLTRNINAETTTEVGDPKDAICEAVEKQNIDLLVIGSHNQGALKRAILGSVSNYCVHNAKCQVLIVPNIA